AYESATADLDDLNLIDPFHLAAYGKQVTSYNRDVEVFPLLRTLLERLTGTSPYASPTDMGVNLAGDCIVDDETCREASRQEIIRRYYKALMNERINDVDDIVSQRIGMVMSKAGCTPHDRAVVEPALAVEARTGEPGAAIQLADGTLITGKTSALLGCSAAMLLNALKHLAGLEDSVQLLSPSSIEPIQTLKTEHLGSRNPRLHTDEVLIALSVSASSDENARRAVEQLRNLAGCDVHTTTILGTVDEDIFRNLGISVTSAPRFLHKALHHTRWRPRRASCVVCSSSSPPRCPHPIACRVSAARKPRVATSPVYRDSSANASGIMVSAIIARIAPAARALTTERAAGGAPSSSAKPASEASPEASAIAAQIPNTYRRLRPARFQPALLERPSGTLEMNTAANIGTLSPGPARTLSPSTMDSGTPSSSAPMAIAPPLPLCSCSEVCWSPERLRCPAPCRASRMFSPT